MIIEKPFDIQHAKDRTWHYADKSERDLWTCNKMLKNEIERCSFMGMSEASVDILLEDCESTSITKELSEMYIDGGYNVKVDRLFNGLNVLTGYRLTVGW